MASRTSHPYQMYDAMFEQPDAIQMVLQTERATAQKAAKLLLDSKVQSVHIVGIGASQVL